MDKVIDSTGWQMKETENGNFLVKSPDGEVFYTDSEGKYLRGVENPEKEWEWAVKNWDQPGIINPEIDFIVTLKNQLKYIV